LGNHPDDAIKEVANEYRSLKFSGYQANEKLMDEITDKMQEYFK